MIESAFLEDLSDMEKLACLYQTLVFALGNVLMGWTMFPQLFPLSFSSPFPAPADTPGSREACM